MDISSLLCSTLLVAKKKRKVETPVAPDPNAQKFEPLDPIRITKAVLWSGYRGVVVSVNGGQHLVKLRGSNGAEFHSYALASEMEFDL